MAQPSPKRRKLSPFGSVQTSLLTDGAQAGIQGAERSSSHRASFMSPTKASLARFNPELLPRAQASEPSRRTRRSSIGKKALSSNSKDTSHLQNGGTGSRSGSELPVADGAKTGSEGRDGDLSPRSGISAAPRRRSQTPNAQHTSSRLSQTQPIYGTRAATSRHTGTIPQQGVNVNESGKETATREDKPQNGLTIDEASLQNLPPTPTRRGIPRGAARLEALEPSLPSTPSQLGLEAPRERPKGPLFGTPSRRTRRQDEGRGRSPSKSQSASSTQSSPDRRAKSILGSKLFLPDLPKPATTPEQVELKKKIASRTELEQDVLRLGSKLLEAALFSSWQNSATKESASQQKSQKRLIEKSGKLIRLREDIEELGSLVGDVLNTQRSKDYVIRLDDNDCR